MTLEEFRRLKNFAETEKDYLGGPITKNIEVLELSFMTVLDFAISFAKEYAKSMYGDPSLGSFIVHCLAYGEHSENSEHYKGNAGDGHFKGLNLFESSMIMIKSGFKGIGIYPEWNIPGIHADFRTQNHLSTWLGYYLRDKKGNFVLDSKGKKIQKYDYDFGNFMDRMLLESEVAYKSPR